LDGLLERGVPRPVMIATLAGMRIWYRLTGLDLRGRATGDILARLNPEEVSNEFEEETPAPPPASLAAAEAEQRRQGDRGSEQEAPDQQAGQQEQPKPKMTGLSDALKAVLNSATKPSGQGAPEPGESLSFKQAVDRKYRKANQGKRDEEKYTPDHIPSGASLIQAEKDRVKDAKESELGRRLTSQEELELYQKEKLLTKKRGKRNVRDDRAEEIYQEGLTLYLRKQLHEQGRTFFSANTPEKVKHDAKNPTKAVELDYRAYLTVLGEELTQDEVIGFIRHYEHLARTKLIDWSPEIDKLLQEAWERVK
jgi:hypothetical protein